MSESRRISRELQEDVLSQYRTVLVNMQPSITKASWNFDAEIMNSSLQGLFKFRGVREAYIFDPHGKALVALKKIPEKGVVPIEKPPTLNEIMGTPNEQPLAPYSKVEEELMPPTRIEGNGDVLLAGALWTFVVEPKHTGSVVLRFSTGFVNERVATQQRKLALFAGSLIFFISLISVLFLRNAIVVPLVALRNASAKIANRQFVKVNVRRGKDEITDVIATFNEMSDEIQRHMHDQQIVAMASRRVSASLTFEDLVKNVRAALEEVCVVESLDLRLFGVPGDPFAELAQGEKVEISLVGWLGGDIYAAPSRRAELVDPKLGTILGGVFFSKHPGNRSEEEVVAIVEAIATSIASTVSTIRHAIEQKINGQLEAEMSATRLVQQALLPGEIQCAGIEAAAFYAPASQTGGDWYGYYSIVRGDVAYFFVGDVTGHGIPSALVTGIVCGAVLACEKRVELGGVNVDSEEHLMLAAHSINHVMVETEARCQKLMTMLMVALNVKTGEFLHLNAGHNHPLHLREDGDVKVLANMGSRLGFTSEPSFAVKKGQLVPGESLFLYTDGLIENSGPDGEIFDLKKLRGFLAKLSPGQSSSSIVASTVEVGQTFWRQNAPADDITILCLRWLGVDPKVSAPAAAAAVHQNPTPEV